MPNHCENDLWVRGGCEGQRQRVFGTAEAVAASAALHGVPVISQVEAVRTQCKAAGVRVVDTSNEETRR